MEYLPEKKRTQKTQVIKKEAKVAEFRRYLADDQVVLAFTKYLVAVRSQQQWPEDPQAHMMDYFGNYKSPEWEEMQLIEDENEEINEKLPEMESKIEQLEAELTSAKRRTRVVEIYKAADPDSTNALSLKAVVQKLSGFAKFEADNKVSCASFTNMIMGHIADTDNEDEQLDTICGCFQKAFVDGQPPFLGDLENETYKEILELFRAYKPTE